MVPGSASTQTWCRRFKLHKIDFTHCCVLTVTWKTVKHLKSELQRSASLSLHSQTPCLFPPAAMETFLWGLMFVTCTCVWVHIKYIVWTGVVINTCVSGSVLCSRRVWRPVSVSSCRLGWILLLPKHQWVSADWREFSQTFSATLLDAQTGNLLLKNTKSRLCEFVIIVYSNITNLWCHLQTFTSPVTLLKWILLCIY